MSAKKSQGGSSKHDEQKYDVHDIVLAKIRGYPPWPARVVDPDRVPSRVTRERPAAKKSFYCVQFFPVGDYAWLMPKDLSKLQKHEIEAYINEPHKKSGELLSGYRVALDPSSWEAEHAQRISEEAEEDVDEDDELDDEGTTEKKKPAKKRKRDTSSEPKKSRGRPKKGEAETKTRGSTANGKKSGTKKSKRSEVESEDEKEDDAKSAPPAKKAKKSKEEDEMEAKFSSDPEAVRVKDWRHKLQKVFLSKVTPKPDDMPNINSMFMQVENYEKMNIDYLSYSKIGKVMRHIAALADCPEDDKYHFRERAQVLVDRWHDIMQTTNASKPKLEAAPSTMSIMDQEPLTAPLNTESKVAPEEPEATTNGAKPDEPQPEATAPAAPLADAPTETATLEAPVDVAMVNGTGTTDADADGEAEPDDAAQKRTEDVVMAEAPPAATAA